MKRNSFSTAAATFACIGLALPPSTLAQQPAARPESSRPQPAFHTTDVALRPGGLIVGQVVNSSGMPQAGATVAILYADREIVRTTTDENGVFAAQGLRGGQYQLVAANGHSACRCWAPDTAPPSARPTALVVTDDSVVRGQFGYPGGGPMHDWVEWIKCHPYITAGVVASAIAIPIALSDDFSSGS